MWQVLSALQTDALTAGSCKELCMVQLRLQNKKQLLKSVYCAKL